MIENVEYENECVGQQLAALTELNAELTKRNVELTSANVSLLLEVDECKATVLPSSLSLSHAHSLAISLARALSLSPRESLRQVEKAQGEVRQPKCQRKED